MHRVRRELAGASACRYATGLLIEPQRFVPSMKPLGTTVDSYSLSAWSSVLRTFLDRGRPIHAEGDMLGSREGEKAKLCSLKEGITLVSCNQSLSGCSRKHVRIVRVFPINQGPMWSTDSSQIRSTGQFLYVLDSTNSAVLQSTSWPRGEHSFRFH